MQPRLLLAFFNREGTLLAHGQLVAHQDAQVLLHKAASQLVSPQRVLMPGVVPFHFVEHHEVPVCPVLQPAELPTNGSTTIGRYKTARSGWYICELADSALCPMIQVINEDVKQYWPQY